MQTSLAQYKIAGYPPDILINVPKRVCRFFEFYKAPEPDRPWPADRQRHPGALRGRQRLRLSG